jgi:hypothetical protein
VAPALGAAVLPALPCAAPAPPLHPFIPAHAPLFGTRRPACSVTKVALLVRFVNRLPCSTSHPGPVARILGGARVHLNSQVP